jgi:hypothetical protein
MKRNTLIASIVIVSSYATAHAADCRPQDFFDDNVKLSNDLYKLAFLDNMTSNTFDYLSKSGKLKADIPIEDIDIGLNMSYDETRNTSKQLQEYKNVNYGEEHRQTLLTHMLSSDGLSGYLGCLTDHNKIEAALLTMDGDAFSSKDFFIKIYWSGGQENLHGKFDKQDGFQIAGEGARVVGVSSDIAAGINSNKEMNVQIHREDLKQPFRFATSINGIVGSIVLPGYNPREVKFEVKEDAVTASSAKHVNGAAKDYKSKSFLGDNTHRFLPATAVLHSTEQGWGPMRADFIVKDPMRIEWFAEAQSQPGDDFASAACTASVSVIQVSWP